MASPRVLYEITVTLQIPLSVATFAEPVPSPGASGPSTGCLNNDLCAFIFRETGQGWLADTTFYLLVKPFRILLILVIALILRYTSRCSPA